MEVNKFLYKQGLSKTEKCNCGAASEDWKHVLVKHFLYDDVKRLNKCGVKVRKDSGMDVTSVLNSKKYKNLCKFTKCVFRRKIKNVQ